MNYNILHGFHKTIPPFNLETDRQKKAVEIVNMIDPDILVLTEACYGEPNKFNIIMNYGKIFQYPFFHFQKWGKFEWGNAILSKYPLTTSTSKFGDRTVLHTKIKIKHRVLFLDVVHPNPCLKESVKAKLYEKLLQNKNTPYIIAGDFNSISPYDYYSKNKLLLGFRKFMPLKKAKEYVEDLLSAKSVKYLLTHGLIDSLSNKNYHSYTVPTNLISKSKNSGVRIDHIFCSHDIRILDAGIVKTSLSEYASDHYPVYTVISI